MSKFSNVSLSEISINDGTERLGLYFGIFAGLAGSSGSTDGTGSAARFNNPAGIAVDTAGNLFVADRGHTIRKVTSAGVVTTIAGLANNQGSADGTGSAARFSDPTSVAVDTAGNVFVADRNNYTIRKITSAGVVTTLAGLAGNVGSADGTGSAARFNNPYGVAVDTSGNVFVADSANNTIRKVTSAGVVTTIAGLAGSSGSADGTGSAARFNFPTRASIDTEGNLYVADQFSNTIRKVTSAGVVTTLAGLAGSSGSTDGTGSAARFNLPAGIAVDTAGNLFVADSDNNTIRKVTSAGVVTTLAGLAGSLGSINGIGSFARFRTPTGIAVDTSGNVFVADSGSYTIRNSNGILTPY
jgi:sugar lactone lactonase YvrE